MIATTGTSIAKLPECVIQSHSRSGPSRPRVDAQSRTSRSTVSSEPAATDTVGVTKIVHSTAISRDNLCDRVSFSDLVDWVRAGCEFAQRVGTGGDEVELFVDVSLDLGDLNFGRPRCRDRDGVDEGSCSRFDLTHAIV